VDYEDPGWRHILRSVALWWMTFIGIGVSDLGKALMEAPLKG
jgi:hypothetical protein